MKKLKLLALAAGLLTSVAASADIVHWYDRTNWEVLGCSEQYNHSWGDKDLDAIIDGDDGSYWHTQYACNANNNADGVWEAMVGTDDGSSSTRAFKYHFFIIDMNKKDANAQYQINAFKYTPCQKNGGNGYCTSYDFYVIDDISWMQTADNDYHHTALKNYLTGKTPTKSGTFSYVSNAQNQAATTVTLDEAVTGHYALFVIKSTVGSGGANKFASCAEFNIAWTETESEIELPEGETVIVNEANGTFNNGVYTSNATITPGVKVTMSVGECLGFNNGWMYMSPRNNTSVFTIESSDPAYYVKAFKFTGTTTESGYNFTLTSPSHTNVTCTNGQDATVSELNIAEGTTATFSVIGTLDQSKKISLKDFVVVLAPATPSAPVIEVSANGNGSAWIGDDKSATSQTLDPENFTSITLHAQANAGHKFTGWTKGTVTVSTDADYTISECPASGTYHYTANFENIYATGQENYTFTRNRYTSALEFKETGKTETLLNITPLQSTTGAVNVFYDKTDKVLNTQSGQAITITPSGYGTWMHQYLYIDRNGDGFQYTGDSDYISYNDADNPYLTPGTDLVYYNYYYPGAADDTGYDMEGNDGVSRSPSYTHEIDLTIPNLPNGTYRARYKLDWNNLDPCGIVGDANLTNSLAKNQGIIVDFTIKIENPVNPKQELYDEFAAEINKYLAVGFPSTWTAGETTHTVADALGDLEAQIDNNVATEDFFKSLIELKRGEILGNITPKGLVRIVSKEYQGKTYFAAEESALSHATDNGVPTSLWHIFYKGSNKFAFKNYHAQKYLGHPTTKEDAIPFVDEEKEYSLEFCEGEDYFALAHGLDGAPYIRRPYRTATDNSVESMSDFAKWHLVPFTGATIEDGLSEDGGLTQGVTIATKNNATGDVTLTFETKEGYDLEIHDEDYYAPEHMRITVTAPVIKAPMRREADFANGLKGSDLDYANNEYSLTIPQAALGYYEVKVPAGFFKTNGELTAAQTIGLTVGSDGVTSITEIAGAAEASETVYDLQGRRLAAPVKGINIINGKKVLVK